jgi:hypothetical protein
MNQLKITVLCACYFFSIAIPSPIQRQLHGGLPHHWKKMMENWVDLLAVFDGQHSECELTQESMEATASGASTVRHSESADRPAGCDELFGETVRPTASVTGLNGREAAELSTASDNNDSVNEGIATEFHNLEPHVKMVAHETLQNNLLVWHKDYSL